MKQINGVGTLAEPSHRAINWPFPSKSLLIRTRCDNSRVAENHQRHDETRARFIGDQWRGEKGGGHQHDEGASKCPARDKFSPSSGKFTPAQGNAYARQ